MDHPTPNAHPRVRGAALRVLVAAALVTLAAVVGAQSTGGATIQVADHPQIGPHLVDAAGMTLYVFADDAPYRPTCVAACADERPPLSFTGLVPTSAGVDAVLVGGVTRPDGSSQAAFDGRPLYGFRGDDAAGSILGIGAGWSAVAVDGTLIETAEAAAGAGAADALSAEELAARGADVYAIYCAACHQADGRGNIGPGLISNARVGDAVFVARQIRDGLGEMPGFGMVLSLQDMAAVATFVRTHFGNAFGPMAPADFER
jgi:mono/diheme cytochrome c family protein